MGQHVFAKDTINLQVKYVNKFVVMESSSTCLVTTGTISTEMDVLQLVKLNTGIYVKDHHIMVAVNVFIKAI